MTSLFKKLSIIVLVASFCSMASFTATAADTEEDAAVLIDLKTERAINRAIFGEPSLSASSIIVGCVDGVVVLHGTVDTAIERQLAEKLAKGVDGVSEVRNNLTTKS